MEAKLTAGLWAMAAAFALCASQAQARCVCNVAGPNNQFWGPDNDIAIEDIGLATGPN